MLSWPDSGLLLDFPALSSLEENYDRLEGAAGWAQQTLKDTHIFNHFHIFSSSQTDWAIGKLELLQTKDHVKDKREYVYSLEAQHGFQSMTLTRDLFICDCL